MSKIIQFARTRTYLVTLISIIVLAVIFMILGISFAVSSGTTTPTFIGVYATNMSSSGNIHTIDIYNRSTPIHIWTAPNNQTNLPVVFDNNRPNIVHITPSIRSGTEATLTLLNNSDGVPTFFDPANPDTHVEIVASVGTQVAVLRIRIRLARENVSLNTELMWWSGARWMPVVNNSLSLFNYRQITQGVANSIRFRVRSTLTIFGVERFSTLTDLDSFASGTDRLFFNLPQEILGIEGPSDIMLFGRGATWHLDIPPGSFAGATYNFLVTIDYAGLTHHDVFNLEITA